MSQYLKNESILGFITPSFSINNNGATGATGERGPEGPMGATGATGEAGPAGSSAIIPYASGAPINLIVSGGSTNNYVVIGFGSSFSIPGDITPGIDLSTYPNVAFSVPRFGTITSVVAYFSTTGTLDLGLSSILITARLFISTAPNNTFSQVFGGALTPSISGIVGTGVIRYGVLSGTPISIPQNTRLLLAFSVMATPGTNATLSGYASGGVAIS